MGFATIDKMSLTSLFPKAKSVVYPTREQAQDMMNCFNNVCRECKAYKPLCYTTRDERGSAWLAVHDALDAKEAELAKARGTVEVCTEMILQFTKERNKAKELVQRFRVYLIQTRCAVRIWPTTTIDQLLEDAKAMINNEVK